MNNKCLNCGAILKNKNKFCNSSCAATYNNKIRKRKKWTLEQKQRLSEQTIIYKNTHIGYKQYKCKYCNKICDSIVCTECKPYVSRIKTYAKFGFISGSLKERNDNLKQLLYTEYFLNEKSTIMLENEYGVSNQTIWNILKREFGECRNLSEGVSLAIKEGRLNTPVSNNFYKTGIHISWDNKQYYYRSSWENQYMNELDNSKICYQYEPFSIIYYNTTKKCNKIAVPDFYLPETNEIIEANPLARNTSTFIYIPFVMHRESLNSNLFIDSSLLHLKLW